MRIDHVNRASAAGMIMLSLIALLLVVWGLRQPPMPPPPDEGTEAHIFQLSIAALLPATLIFASTADWTRPRHSMRPLVLAAAFTVLAFALLYYLEHRYLWSVAAGSG